MITFILGGARSGKSRFAQKLATEFAENLADLQDNDGSITQNQSSYLPVFYVATAQAFDDEMTKRIMRHQHDRPSHWHTIESPIQLSDTILTLSQKPCVILVDCLTLWVNNLLLIKNPQVFCDEKEKFIDVLQQFPKNCQLILVSNETGLGVVPMGQLTRQFVDESGFLHQKIAEIANQVWFCVAGLTMSLKG